MRCSRISADHSPKDPAAHAHAHGGQKMGHGHGKAFAKKGRGRCQDQKITEPGGKSAEETAFAGGPRQEKTSQCAGQNVDGGNSQCDLAFL